MTAEAISANLTPRQFEAFNLRRVKEYTEPETAKLMQVSTRRVRTLISEARHRLRVSLGINLPTLPHGRPPGRTETGDILQFDSI